MWASERCSLRRWTARGPSIVYFCLVSFISFFKYTGQVNDFECDDLLEQIAAWIMQPAMSLHFVLLSRRSGRPYAIIRTAGAGCMSPRIRCGHDIRRCDCFEAREHWPLEPTGEMSYGALFSWSGTHLLWYSYDTPVRTILRRAVEWVTGARFSPRPLHSVYVISYLMGSVPGPGKGLRLHWAGSSMTRS